MSVMLAIPARRVGAVPVAALVHTRASKEILIACHARLTSPHRLVVRLSSHARSNALLVQLVLMVVRAIGAQKASSRQVLGLPHVQGAPLRPFHRWEVINSSTASATRDILDRMVDLVWLVWLANSKKQRALHHAVSVNLASFRLQRRPKRAPGVQSIQFRSKAACQRQHACATLALRAPMVAVVWLVSRANVRARQVQLPALTASEVLMQ